MDGICIKEIQKQEWKLLKNNIGMEMYQIFNQVELCDKGKDWHLILGELCKVYETAMEDKWSKGQYYLNGKLASYARMKNIA